ncbi:molybdenum cofactor guanylyltransferase [Alkalihalobacillus sp. 1P02AB]|uniref:molybdenum cofactor guanylyltransferase n=1 Tax=Alkalihalobacillus sp. 1P02AB TaxID=3132260 RepID=UPI0039A7746B
MKRIGVLLAGGESRRYGSPKAFAMLNSKPFYQHSLTCLESFTDKQLIISHPNLVLNFKQNGHKNIYTDKEPYQGLGPLAGIFSAMEYEDSDWYVIAPCDTPYIKESIYQRLIQQLNQPNSDYDVVIPLVNGKRQTLIGLYHIRTKPKIKQLLEEKTLKVGALFQRVNTLFVEDSMFDKDPQSFLNINHIHDKPKE